MPKKKRLHGIDFEKLFLKGRTSYDTAIGDWWDQQSCDGPHRKAYADVADYGFERMRAARIKPDLLVDYACGSGHFLAALARRFPESRIVALDGSPKMLSLAGERLARAGQEADRVDKRRAFEARGPRIRLVETSLPNFSLPAGKASAVFFVFPNLTPAPDDQEYYDRHGYKNRPDGKVCTVLARLREMDPEDEVNTVKPKELYEGLMTDRVVSRNLRGLLRKGGTLFKVDYANAPREELSPLTHMRSLFVEGALEEPVKEMRSEAFFRYAGNRFRRSQVILDVYHQTQDPTDRTGGYFISDFRAI
ncbi:MAG: class I SAM-dependent methyltransferase [Fibrobacteres bacterium]|nr:class I SAM-dependent methyltransferase [Fibrobacterota bacterium]